MNVLDALDARGIPYRKSGRPDEVFLCCPFCVENNESTDTRFRLGINVQDGRANCFNCHWRTKNKEFLVQELNRALQTGMFDLGGVAKPAPVKVRLPEDFEVLQKPGKEKDFWNNKAYHYVHSRNVTDAQIKDHKIGYSTVGPLAYRVIIPIYYKKKLKGLVGRDFTGEQEPKYKNSIGEKVLYGIPEAKALGVVLVEGVFDKLAVERGALACDTAAVLGHSLTDKQLAQLKGYKRITLWPDPDEVGVTGFLKMVTDLVSITKRIYIIVPEMQSYSGVDLDPSDYSPSEVAMKLKHAKPYTPELEQRLRAWVAFRKDE